VFRMYCDDIVTCTFNLVVFALYDYFLPAIVQILPEHATLLLPNLRHMRVSYLNLPAVYNDHYCAMSATMPKMLDCIVDHEWRWKKIYAGTIGSIFLSLIVCMLAQWCCDHVVDINSKLISVMIKLTNQVDSPRNIRNIFLDVPIPAITVAKKMANHTHPLAASTRNSSTGFMDAFSRCLGKSAYFVQKSESDVNKKRDGSRNYYWDRDVNVEYAGFSPNSDQIIYYGDVDYYMDMPHYLSNYYGIHVISTFTPNTVTEDEGEYTFTFNEKSEVIYKVSGGATYKHQVWNYATDVLSVKKKLWWTLYIMTYNVVYNVEKKMLDRHHSIVLLSPMKRYYGFRWMKTLGHELSRLSCVNNGFLRMQIMDKDGIKISTGKVMNYYSTVVPAVWDESIATAAKVSPTKLSPGLLRTICNDIKLDQNQAYLLTDYHNSQGVWGGPTVYPIAESVYNYTYITPFPIDDAFKTVIPFMHPFILDCYAPTVGKNSEVRAIEGRVLELRKVNQVRSPFLNDCMMEFTDFMVPVKHKGHPVGYGAVYDRQKRPAQVNILNRASQQVELPEKKVTNIFLKRETYQDVKDPRLITVYDGKVKLEYSTFIYSFADNVMNEMKWYAFAKTPIVIAGIVSSICMGSKKNVVSTDLSRMDGHVVENLRDLERMIMLAYFAKEYHTELLRILLAQTNNRAYSKEDLSFLMEFIRGSGSLETAVMNSVLNKFMAYYCFRKMGLSPIEAWEAAGIYGGDDGMTADVDPHTYELACAECGQVLTCEEYKPGERGVNFLARVYSPSIWTGDLDSMCDIRRQLAKFHVTVNLPDNITPMQKLVEKCAGYIATDENTPIIGEICKAVSKVTKVYKGNNPNLRGIANYFSNFTKEVQFPNNNVGNWMDDEVHRALPTFDFSIFNDYIAGVMAGTTSPLKPNLCEPDKQLTAKSQVVINGNLVGEKKESPRLPPLPHWIKDTTTGIEIQPTSNVNFTKLELPAHGVKTPPKTETPKSIVFDGGHGHFKPLSFDPTKPPNFDNNPFAALFPTNAKLKPRTETNSESRATEQRNSPSDKIPSATAKTETKEEIEDGEIVKTGSTPREL